MLQQKRVFLLVPVNLLDRLLQWACGWLLLHQLLNGVRSSTIDGSLPGSSIHGILQARILEWGAISFSNAWKWKVKVKSLSCARLLATPWTAAYQAPLSMGLSRQEYWSGVPLNPWVLLKTRCFQLTKDGFRNVTNILKCILCSEELEVHDMTCPGVTIAERETGT